MGHWYERFFYVSTEILIFVDIGATNLRTQ